MKEFPEAVMAQTEVDLWRGVHTSEMAVLETDTGPVVGVLYPTFTRKEIGKDKETGAPRYREPDVAIRDDMVQRHGGTSLFDIDRFFPGKAWNFFKIPKGTEIDPLLHLKGPDWNERFKANHYQIEVDKPITVDAYKGALDNFARAAFAKRYVDARSGGGAK
jgi:hypothetical protein